MTMKKDARYVNCPLRPEIAVALMSHAKENRRSAGQQGAIIIEDYLRRSVFRKASPKTGKRRKTTNP